MPSGPTKICKINGYCFGFVFIKQRRKRFNQTYAVIVIKSKKNRDWSILAQLFHPQFNLLAWIRYPPEWMTQHQWTRFRKSQHIWPRVTALRRTREYTWHLTEWYRPANYLHVSRRGSSHIWIGWTPSFHLTIDNWTKLSSVNSATDRGMPATSASRTSVSSPAHGSNEGTPGVRKAGVVDVSLVRHQPDRARIQPLATSMVNGMSELPYEEQYHERNIASLVHHNVPQAEFFGAPTEWNLWRHNLR